VSKQRKETLARAKAPPELERTGEQSGNRSELSNPPACALDFSLAKQRSSCFIGSKTYFARVSRVVPIGFAMGLQNVKSDVPFATILAIQTC
jgi:hypothetical protein